MVKPSEDFKRPRDDQNRPVLVNVLKLCSHVLDLAKRRRLADRCCLSVCLSGSVKRSSPVIAVVSQLKGVTASQRSEPAPGHIISLQDPSCSTEDFSTGAARRPSLRCRPVSASSTLRPLLAWGDEFQATLMPAMGETKNRCSVGQQPDVGVSLSVVSMKTLHNTSSSS